MYLYIHNTLNKNNNAALLQGIPRGNSTSYLSVLSVKCINWLPDDHVGTYILYSGMMTRHVSMHI